MSKHLSTLFFLFNSIVPRKHHVYNPLSDVMFAETARDKSLQDVCVWRR